MDQAWILWVSSAMAAYFAGSLPFSWLLARWLKGVDLRQVGSGNIGATNASRVLGARWGGIALLLDAMKGLLPTWGCPWIWSEQAVGVQTLRVWCGIWAILGHTFPIWLGFRGGKGVATTLGVVTILAPWATLWAALAFAISFGLKRIVSLSSLAAATVFLVVQLWQLYPRWWQPEARSLTAFSVAIPLLIVWRHRTNIVRLWRGEEPTWKPGTSPPKSTPPSS